MSLKAFLLASAAAIAAASSAEAADTIVAAPEPVEYVRVCDAFGSGFFYIPGTETCMQIGGYVRFDANGGDLLGLDTDGDGKGDAWSTKARLSLTMDVRTDTELGTLRAYTETHFDYDNGVETDPLGDAGETSIDLNYAYIELGGFRAGRTESEFTRLDFYPNGYAGGVIQDTLVGYGPFEATQISYTYRTSGFSAVLALEDDNAGSHDRSAIDPTAPAGNYVPDVIAGTGYTTDSFGLALVGAYDESLGEGAVKARIDATFGKVAAFVMAGWSSNGDETGLHGCTEDSITSCGSNHFAVWGGDWGAWGGFTVSFTEKFASNVQVSYDDAEDFGAAANLAYALVEGLTVTAEVDYADSGDAPGSNDIDEAWGGMLRFERTF